jgi:hypothetical protein
MPCPPRDTVRPAEGASCITTDEPLRLNRIVLGGVALKRRVGNTLPRILGFGAKKQDRRPRLFLLLMLSLVFGQALNAATLFPNRARGWDKIPTIVILGKEGDPRIQLVHEAVDFWR